MPRALDGPEVVRRYAAGRSSRANFNSYWERGRRIYLSGTGSFTAQQVTQGQRDRQTTVDSYPAYVNRTRAEFLYSALVNPDGDWFSFVPFGKLVKFGTATLRWLDEMRDQIAEEMLSPAVGFDTNCYSMLQEYGLGNGCLYVGDRPGRLPIVRHGSMPDVVWEERDGEIENFFWRQRLPICDAVDKFGEAKLSDALRTVAADPKRQNDRFNFIHALVENPDYERGAAHPGKRRFVSLWVEEESSHAIGRTFLDGHRYTAFRAPCRPGEAYAYGPAIEGLEESQLAQRARVSIIRAIEKAVDTTIILPDDGIKSPPTHEARGAIIVRADLLAKGNRPIQQLVSEGRPDLGQEFLTKSVYGALDRIFMRDQMQLPRDARMLNPQILGIQAEQARAVAPMIAHLQAPIGRVIGQFYALRHRQGALPPMPAEAKGITVAVEFQSPLTRGMQLTQVRAFQQALELGAQAAAVDPAAAHVLDVVEGFREACMVLGVSARLIATPDQIAAVKAAIDERAKAAEQTQAGLDVSQMAQRGAPLLKAIQGGQSGGPAQAAA